MKSCLIDEFYDSATRQSQGADLALVSRNTTNHCRACAQTRVIASVAPSLAAEVARLFRRTKKINSPSTRDFSKMAIFNPVLLIEEVQKRPGLYKADCPADREEKLASWKEIGAAMYPDWNTINKATAYDRGNRTLLTNQKWC